MAHSVSGTQAMAKTYDPCRLAGDIAATVADANRLPTNRYPNAAAASNPARDTSTHK